LRLFTSSDVGTCGGYPASRPGNHYRAEFTGPQRAKPARSVGGVRLAEVASVALVQSVRARTRPVRSPSTPVGVPQGSSVGKPRFNVRKDTGLHSGFVRFAVCAATNPSRTDLPDWKHHARQQRKLL